MKNIVMIFLFLLLLNVNSEAVVEEKLNVEFATTTGTTTLNRSGVLSQYVVISPDLSTSTELSITVTNTDGVVLYTSGNIAESTSNFVRLPDDASVLLGRKSTITAITTSTQANAVDKSVSVIFYMKED